MIHVDFDHRNVEHRRGSDQFALELIAIAENHLYTGCAIDHMPVRVTLKLKESAYTAWQLKSWTALRDADQAAYTARLEQAKERKAYLEAEMAKFDALTLRKMEREEVMRWVLRWLIGFDRLPSELEDQFTCYPPNDPTTDPCTGKYADPTPCQYAYPDEDSPDDYRSFGEFIKYIHNAIEWENVLFFAYPYFWDHTGNWPFKRFMMHPDPIHREFLRSGAMRVVLTIRPGFEQSFALLVSDLDSLPDGDPKSKLPYVTIADEIRNFAMTNYEGIPPANPDRNVRPLLYWPQRKAWDDMQKLIELIERYSEQQHERTLSTAVTANGEQTATLSDMTGIAYDVRLTIDAGTKPDPITKVSPEEVVVVTKTTGPANNPTNFTAIFNNAHSVGAPVLVDPAVNLYPTDGSQGSPSPTDFPGAIQALVGSSKLPLNDFWGNTYHYKSPGLNADYELVCYGLDNAAGEDPTKPDPLNADITRYAEGSIVGRWYEYTPTGALDVSINTILPTKPQPA
jgi:Type II secretion system (T2SS), protein G